MKQQTLDLLLTGGELVTGGASYKGNIGIKDGKIAVISTTDVKLEALRTIDATGKIVMPGVIDPHVHLRTAFSTVADSMEFGSISAAYGGVTTLFVFIAPSTGTKPVKELPTMRAIDTTGLKMTDYFAKEIAEYQKQAVVDFSFHCFCLPDETLIPQVGDVIKLGITSFKIMLGYPKWRGFIMTDDLIKRYMETIVRSGGLAQVHCENGWLIGQIEDKLVAEGKYSAENFLKAKDNWMEAMSVNQLTTLAGMVNCPLYIVHLSTKEGLEEAIRAKSKGWDVTLETCPQYLLLTDEHLQKAAQRNEGPLGKMAPPLRTTADNEALWMGIRQGFIEVVGTDHAGWSKSQKLEAPTFWQAPFGIPGLETSLPLMYSEGVAKGRISLNQMVKVMCENPARKFGLYPRKGVIALGADADLVVFDPGVEWVIKAQELHSKAEYTPYEGWRVVGKPILSLLRGQLLLENGKLRQAPGFGRFIRRPVS